MDVIFSLHCFTRGTGDCPPPADLLYSDGRETRVFDFGRFRLSRELPAIIDTLMSRKCFHTGHGNFFTVNLVDDAGHIVTYEIYFTVSKSSKRSVLNLYVQSAYTRDASHTGNRPRSPKPIGLGVILFNTLHGVHIKLPK